MINIFFLKLDILNKYIERRDRFERIDFYLRNYVIVWRLIIPIPIVNYKWQHRRYSDRDRTSN